TNDNNIYENIHITIDNEQLLSSTKSAGISRIIVEDINLVYSKNPIRNEIINLFGLTTQTILNIQIKINLDNYCHIDFIEYNPRLGVMEFCKHCNLLRIPLVDSLLYLNASKINSLISRTGINNVINKASLIRSLNRLKNFHISPKCLPNPFNKKQKNSTRHA